VCWVSDPQILRRRQILKEPFDIKAYVLDAGRFTITAYTPVFVGKVQAQDDLQQAANRYSRRGKKIRDDKFDPTDEPFYEWVRNASQFLDNVVTFEIRPDFGQTTGSMWASALGAFAAGASNTPYMPSRQTIEFKAEFLDFRIYRDGQLVTPITPGRMITEQSINSSLMTFIDEAYSGLYVFHPSVFLTGKDYKIEVYDAREPGRAHRVVSFNEQSRLVQQIRRDFEVTQ
jgi:hypothetical protein